jgi:hypothetical protein
MRLDLLPKAIPFFPFLPCSFARGARASDPDSGPLRWGGAPTRPGSGCMRSCMRPRASSWCTAQRHSAARGSALTTQPGSHSTQTCHRIHQPRAPAEPFLTPDVCAAASCRAAAATVERGITAGTVTTSAVKKRIHVVQANTQTRDRHRAATVRLGSIRADLRRRPALDAALEGTKTAPDIHLARSVLMARSSRMTGTAAA